MTSPDPTESYAAATLAPFRLATLAVERGIDNIRTEWDLLVTRVQAGIRVVEQWLDNKSLWDSFVEWLTDDIKDALKHIRELLETARQKVDEVLKVAKFAFSRSLPVISLMETSLDYLPAIVTPVSDIKADLDPPGKNIAYWDGPSQKAYLNVAQEQLDALGQSIDKAKTTSSWLVEVAKANVSYMAGLADRVAAVAAEITKTCLEGGATMVGVVTQFQTSLQDFAEVIGTVVGELISYAAHLAERLTEVVESVQRLAVELVDNSEVGGGRWPQSVANG